MHFVRAAELLTLQSVIFTVDWVQFTENCENKESNCKIVYITFRKCEKRKKRVMLSNSPYFREI